MARKFTVNMEHVERNFRAINELSSRTDTAKPDQVWQTLRNAGVIGQVNFSEGIDMPRGKFDKIIKPFVIGGHMNPMEGRVDYHLFRESMYDKGLKKATRSKRKAHTVYRKRPLAARAQIATVCDPSIGLKNTKCVLPSNPSAALKLAFSEREALAERIRYLSYQVGPNSPQIRSLEKEMQEIMDDMTLETYKKGM